MRTNQVKSSNEPGNWSATERTPSVRNVCLRAHSVAGGRSGPVGDTAAQLVCRAASGATLTLTLTLILTLTLTLTLILTLTLTVV